MKRAPLLLLLPVRTLGVVCRNVEIRVWIMMFMLVCSLHGIRIFHGGVAGWSDPRTDWAAPGMRTLQWCKERNGQIHVRVWPFEVTGDVTWPVSMFGCTDMALSPGSLHQRLHLWCGSCSAIEVAPRCGSWLRSGHGPTVVEANS